MRSPLWGLMVDAAQREVAVVMHIAGQREPLVGVPTLPVAANHVVLRDGAVVSLSAVAVAQLQSQVASAPADPEEPF